MVKSKINKINNDVDHAVHKAVKNKIMIMDIVDITKYNDTWKFASLIEINEILKNE